MLREDGRHGYDGGCDDLQLMAAVKPWSTFSDLIPLPDRLPEELGSLSCRSKIKLNYEGCPSIYMEGSSRGGLQPIRLVCSDQTLGSEVTVPFRSTEWITFRYLTSQNYWWTADSFLLMWQLPFIVGGDAAAAEARVEVVDPPEAQLVPVRLRPAARTLRRRRADEEKKEWLTLLIIPSSSSRR